MLVEFGKYNRTAIMRKAMRMAKSCYDGNLSKALKAAWKHAKLEMAEVTNIQPSKWNPYTRMSDLYCSSNMRNGFATR